MNAYFPSFLLALGSLASGQMSPGPGSLDFGRFEVVRPGQIAVQRRASPTWTAIAERHGLDLASLREEGRNFARFAVPPSTEAEQIELLVADEDILFAARIYEGPEGFWEHPIQGVLVRFDASVPDASQRALLESLPSARIDRERFGGMNDAWRLGCLRRRGTEVLDLARALANTEGIQWAEPNACREVTFFEMPEDPLWPSSWGLENDGNDCNMNGVPDQDDIAQGTSTDFDQDGVPDECAGINKKDDFDMDALAAWDRTLGKSTSIVVVIDDGVQQNHPDINQIPGTDFTGSGTGGGPGSGADCHGTAVAGCVSGRANKIGSRGIAPGVRIASARYSTKTGTTCTNNGTFSTSDLVDAIEWSSTLNAAATCNSFGVGTSNAISDAYQEAADDGVVHFGATGNSSATSIGFPASHPSVLAIGSVQMAGTLSGFSNTGAGIFAVAPGSSIDTTDRTGTAGYNNSAGTAGDYTNVNGTSFATPYSAGIAALIHSIDDSLTSDEVRDVLQESAVDLGSSGYDTSFGNGLLNAGKALQFVGDVYLDEGPLNSGTGTYADPYAQLWDAEFFVPTGGAMIVRPGSFSVGNDITFDKAMTIIAPKGGVVFE